jgi:hypothetical protein
MFTKYVVPDSQCVPSDDGPDCHYVDSIREIFISPGFAIQPLIPPTDTAHEILIEIESFGGVLVACQPFPAIASLPVNSPVGGGGYGIGAPVDRPTGLGQPSLFATVNHVLTGILPDGALSEADLSWNQPTTLSSLYAGVAQRVVGLPYRFTYSASDATMQYLVWYPDLPSCDVIGNDAFPVQYGHAGVELLFKIFQATGN